LQNKLKLKLKHIEVFKMLNGYTRVNVEQLFSFTNQRHDLQTRSATSNLLVAEKCRLDVRKFFFTNRIVNTWNELPIDIREAESVNSFKNLYDDFKDTVRTRTLI